MAAPMFFENTAKLSITAGQSNFSLGQYEIVIRKLVRVSCLSALFYSC